MLVRLFAMPSGHDPRPTRPKVPLDSVPDQDYVSAEELFGEIVDGPMPAAPPAAVPPRGAPIRVKVPDPRQTPGWTPRAPEVAASSETDVDALLSRLDPLEEAVPEDSPLQDFESGPLADLAEEESLLSPDFESDLPPDAPQVPDFEEELPSVAARTSTRFEVAPPRLPGKEGLDLADLAETALAEVTPAPPVGAARAGAWRDDSYGPYHLLDRIAVGGMAEVFKAKRSGVEGFEKIVAVKRILPHLSDNQEFVNMFVDEAKMVAGLTHPNIVQIFDLGKIDKSYYIAMEYVHGRDLRTILRRAKEKGLRMPIDLCVRIAGQVCSALEYAHRKKDDRGRAMEIVHRDVSPQNILISFEGDVKLADFGIAKAATKASSTDNGALRGKLLYMSPEQAWGRSMDRRSDLFSLGIVLYEMVTDKKPFTGGATEVSILEMVRQCQIDPPRQANPRIPESLEAVILRALDREPEKRFQDAAVMHRALDKVLRERQPPSASELARFMEVLFDRHEREEAIPEEHPSGEHETAGQPGDRAEPDDITALPDPMSVDVLLKRFGIK